MAGRTSMPPIVSITFVEALPTREMYSRPYQPQGNESIIDALLESTNDGANLSPNAMIPVAGSIMRPAAQVDQQNNQIVIPNGFEYPRFRLVLVLEIERGQFMTTNEVVTGYSDYLGISPDQQFDPNMRLFFNSTTTYKNMAAGVGGMGTTLQDSTQLLTPLTGWDNHSDRPIINQRAATLRPSDVMTRLSYGAGMAEESLTRGQGGFGAPGQTRVLSDSRTQFGARVKRSSRLNATNTHYLSKFFNTYTKTMWDSELEAGDVGGIFSKAASALADPLAANDQFLMTLTNETGYTHEWSITWAELMAIDPSLEDRANVIFMKTAERSSRHLDAESWTDAGHCAQVAQMTLNLLPGVMAEHTLGLLWFTLTNETLSGRPIAKVTNMAGISEFIDPEPLLDAVEQRLAGDVFMQLTNAGMLTVNMDVRMSLSGLSTVELSVNGSVMTPYSAPTYCDSLYSPVITGNIDNLAGLANDLGTLGGNFTARSQQPASPNYRDHNYQESAPMSSPLYHDNTPAPDIYLGTPGGQRRF